MAGASANLGQSANWRALFEGFPPLARVMNRLPTPMQKWVFLGFFTRSCLQGNESTCWGECHESVFKLCHCSQVTEWALQLCGMGNCRDGEKLLCNTCTTFIFDAEEVSGLEAEPYNTNTSPSKIFVILPMQMFIMDVGIISCFSIFSWLFYKK